MNNRLGLTSYAYYWATSTTGHGAPACTPFDLVDKTAELGLAVLQICENVSLVGWEPARLVALRDAARRSGVTLQVGARGPDDADLRAALEAARILESRLLRVVLWSGVETRQQLSLADMHGVVAGLLPLCHAYDVTLAIENYFGFPDDELAAFVRRFDDERVGVCLDTANSTGRLVPTLDTVRLLAPYAVSVHLKDYAVTKHVPGSYRIDGVPLGQGWLDVPAVLDAVVRAGRHPDVLIELWTEPSETPEATRRTEDDWMRQSVAYLSNIGYHE